MVEQIIQTGLQYFIKYATDHLMVTMLGIFAVGITVRWLMYYTQSLANNFVREFEKRLYTKLNAEEDVKDISFFRLVKHLLEQTYFEFFELRARFRRRKRIDDNDNLKIFRDRMLLVQDGCALLVKDTLKQVRYLKLRRATPSTLDISKSAFDNNQAFSKFFGIFSAQPVNSIIENLPGMFIVFGIFGTFLGIMQALPELRGMDISDAEQTKVVMDAFLLKVSFALSSSILGILLSVCMTFFNNMYDPEAVYMSAVERFSSCLKVAWNRSVANKADDDISAVEDTIPVTEIEAEAEAVLEDYLDKRKLSETWRDGKTQPKVYNPEIATEEPPMADEHGEGVSELPNTSSHRMDSINEPDGVSEDGMGAYSNTRTYEIDAEAYEERGVHQAEADLEKIEADFPEQDLHGEAEEIYDEDEEHLAEVEEFPKTDRPKRPQKKKRSA